MPKTSVSEGLEGLPNLRQFRAGQWHGDAFYRLSGPPMVDGGTLPTVATRLSAAWALNRRHYMPYCSECGLEAEFDHNDLRVWKHAGSGEGLVDHIATMTSEPDSYSPVPDGLRYLLTYGMVPMLWVLNDGHVIVPALSPERAGLVRMQLRAIESIGRRVDARYL